MLITGEQKRGTSSKGANKYICNIPKSDEWHEMEKNRVKKIKAAGEY